MTHGWNWYLVQIVLLYSTLLVAQTAPPPLPPLPIPNQRSEPVPGSRTTLPDLRRIGHISPKGRVQDREYNPDLLIVDQLIEVGPDCLQYLVSKLDDHTVIRRQPGEIMDYCGFVTVSEIAYVILSDFLTTADWKSSTFPGGLQGVLEETKPLPFHDRFHDHLKKHGPKSIKVRVEGRLHRYLKQFRWDAKEKCFRAVNP